MSAVGHVLVVLVFLTGVAVWTLVLIGVLAGGSFRIGVAIGRLFPRHRGGDSRGAATGAVSGGRVPRDDDDAAWLTRLNSGLKRPVGEAGRGSTRTLASGAAGAAGRGGLYGPDTAVVLRFLEELRRPGTWTPERVRACHSIRWAFGLAHFAARQASRRTAAACQPPRERQRAAAMAKGWNVADENKPSGGWAAGWAAAALAVRDLIDEKHFATLTRPFADLVAEYDAVEIPDV